MFYFSLHLHIVLCCFTRPNSKSTQVFYSKLNHVSLILQQSFEIEPRKNILKKIFSFKHFLKFSYRLLNCRSCCFFIQK